MNYLSDEYSDLRVGQYGLFTPALRPGASWPHAHYVLEHKSSKKLGTPMFQLRHFIIVRTEDDHRDPNREDLPDL